MGTAILAALVIAPGLLAYLLKSNAALGFLALCGGFTVMTLSGGNIEQLVGQTKITALTPNNVALGLLFIPLLITLLASYRSMRDRSRRLLQLVPGLCAGALLAVVAGPILNESLNTNLADSAYWTALQDAEPYIVGAGLLVSLLLIWSAGAGKHHSKKHSKE